MFSYDSCKTSLLFSIVNGNEHFVNKNLCPNTHCNTSDVKRRSVSAFSGVFENPLNPAKCRTGAVCEGMQLA